MIPFKTIPKGTQIYTWINEETGENFHIHTPKLRDWIAKQDLHGKLEILQTRVHEEIAADFMRVNSVSPERIVQLATEAMLGKRKLDPIIFCERGTYTNGEPDVMLVDGHHRYMIFAIAKIPMIPCYVLKPRQWMPFRVIDAPDLNIEQLARIPLIERNY